jgi:AcrR family transcriptional regulator
VATRPAAAEKSTRKTASPTKATATATTPARRTYLNSSDREKQIVQGAIKYFADKGLAGNTRDLTNSLGIAHGLLFKHFPTKEALIERVYKEMFELGWDPAWERVIQNRQLPLRERLVAVYASYLDVVCRYDWVRIYLYAGLAGTTLNVRYWGMVRENLFRHVIEELRFEHHKPSLTVLEADESELELVWALHSPLFYQGIRQWVYMLDTPKDRTASICQRVDAFMDAAPRVLARIGAESIADPADPTDPIDPMNPKDPKDPKDQAHKETY